MQVKFTRIYELLFKYYGPQNWWPADHWFEVVVGAVLTQNTNWSNVEIALRELRIHDLLDIAAMRSISPGDLENRIRAAGFFRRKAGTLKLLVNWLDVNLAQLENQSTTQTRASLLDIKGIGPETADAILLYALGKRSFVIDKYTSRIVHRMSAQHPALSYDELQNLFVGNISESTRLYQEYHALLVCHAKQFCRKKPICPGCPLAGDCCYRQAIPQV